MAHRGGRGDRGRLALVEASLTALSGAASGARTPLPGAAPQRARPLEAANARWNFDVPDILTSREFPPKRVASGLVAPTPSWEESACERQAR